MASQNIYDVADFFAAYSQLDRSVRGLAGAPEWPALQALLPDPSGLDIVDLGCGFGWFCRWACERGAARVTGIDLSERMLGRAHAETSDPAISYARADLERLDLPPGAFDLAYSSLALHYIVDLEGLLATVYRALRPNGMLVFSAEHPVITAPSHPGWSIGADGRRVWPINNYLVEGPRKTRWLADGVIKQHRTIGTYLSNLLRTGFAIARVEEWGPSERPDRRKAGFGR